MGWFGFPTTEPNRSGKPPSRRSHRSRKTMHYHMEALQQKRLPDDVNGVGARRHTPDRTRPDRTGGKGFPWKTRRKQRARQTKSILLITELRSATGFVGVVTVGCRGRVVRRVLFLLRYPCSILHCGGWRIGSQREISVNFVKGCFLCKKRWSWKMQ